MSTAPQKPPVTPPEPEPRIEPLRPPRRSRRAWILGAVALLVVAVAARAFVMNRGRVTTDDAQVEGHIVPVIAKVGGYVMEVRVQENQPVHGGDLLIRLDDRDLRTRLAEAEAQVFSAQAVAGAGGATGEARARLAAARAAVLQADAAARRARADLERFRALAEHNIISRQQLDQSQAASTSANAQLSAAREQVLAAQAGERGAHGQLDAATAAREAAALQVSYARVTAPLDGIVSRKAIEVGQLVQPGQQVMSVVPLADIWVVANFKETQLRGIDPGDAVDIRVDGDPSRAHRGRVESISPATGAKFSLLPPDNASGNFTKVVQRVPVRIRFAESNDASHPMRPGMSVKVTIHTQ